MSNEPIEAWRKQFEQEMAKTIPSLRFAWHEEGGQYISIDTQLCWLTWVTAKRSQPVIEIDKLSRYGSTDDILCCITEAGYKYKVRE